MVSFEPLDGILPHGLQHLISGGSQDCRLGRDHRLRYQLGEGVEHLGRFNSVTLLPPLRQTGRRRSLERHPDGQTRTARCQTATSTTSSTVARSVWWRSTDRRRPPVNRRKRSSRSLAISPGWQGGDSGRCEFEGERNAVEPSPYLADSGSAPGVDVEVGVHRAGAVEKQLTGIGRHDLVRRSGGRWCSERSHSAKLFAVDPQALPCSWPVPSRRHNCGAVPRQRQPLSRSRAHSCPRRSMSDDGAEPRRYCQVWTYLLVGRLATSGRSTLGHSLRSPPAPVRPARRHRDTRGGLLLPLGGQFEFSPLPPNL